MIERFAVDTCAVVDLMRENRETPPQLLLARIKVYLPVPVLAELYVGILGSSRAEHQLRLLKRVASQWAILQPTQYTARTYAEVRVALKQTTLPAASKLNDLWIAALCLEHNLPLLTNDHGFDHIAGLSVVHW